MDLTGLNSTKTSQTHNLIAATVEMNMSSAKRNRGPSSCILHQSLAACTHRLHSKFSQPQTGIPKLLITETRSGVPGTSHSVTHSTTHSTSHTAPHTQHLTQHHTQRLTHSTTHSTSHSVTHSTSHSVTHSTSHSITHPPALPPALPPVNTLLGTW